MQTTSDTILHVEALSYGRAGVARADGKVVFVEGTAPGDRVRATITRDHGAYAEGRMAELVEAGRARVQPPCSIAGVCGGCPWQHVGYQDQLEAKRRAVVDALERIAGLPSVGVEAVRASPQTTGYRNRLKLRFENGTLGFYSARTHRLVPVRDCLVAEDRLREALPSVEAFVASLATRVLRVEIASRAELRGVVLAINGKGRLRRADVHRVRAYLGARGNPVTGVVMWGKGWRRQWGDTRRRFVIDASGTTIESQGASFGQVNTEANKLLVDAVLRAAGPGGSDDVLDLYAGAGNFSLPIARACRRLTAVESDASAVEAARLTAKHHKMTNLVFHHERVEHYLARQTERAADLVVINPPRSGLGACVEPLARLRIPRMVYASCNPTTLARDLKALAAHGYEPRRIVPIDLFPHSFHVEAVCGIELT